MDGEHSIQGNEWCKGKSNSNTENRFTFKLVEVEGRLLFYNISQFRNGLSLFSTVLSFLHLLCAHVRCLYSSQTLIYILLLVQLNFWLDSDGFGSVNHFFSIKHGVASSCCIHTIFCHVEAFMLPVWNSKRESCCGLRCDNERERGKIFFDGAAPMPFCLASMKTVSRSNRMGIFRVWRGKRWKEIFGGASRYKFKMNSIAYGRKSGI